MYILDYDRQISMIREMTQLRKDTENWVVYYHHPTTNEMWKSYFPRANGEKRGPKILRTEPVPDELEVRIDECLTSDEKENAMGLGIELSVRPDQWAKIMEIIEQDYRKYDRKQLITFLEHLEIFNPEAFFEEIGRSPDIYGLTSEELNELSWKAKKLRFKRFWVFW